MFMYKTVNCEIVGHLYAHLSVGMCLVVHFIYTYQLQHFNGHIVLECCVSDHSIKNM